MLDLKEKYIVNKNQQPVAVQLDIQTFKKIEEVLENYALGKLMDDTIDDERFSLKEAQAYYKKLLKSNG